MRNALSRGLGFVMVAWTMTVAAEAPRPDALLVVDMHRSAIVDRTLAAWPESLDTLQADALRKTLWALRADRLLAASLSPGLPGLLDVLDMAERTGQTTGSRVAEKALGDPLADLVYTPLTPCRIADTRGGGGVLVANTPRTLVGFHASSFASQGGFPSNCGIPNGVAALAMNVYAVNPTITGFIKLWAANQAEPAVSTVNYEPPTTAIATGTIVPVDAASANQFKAQSTSNVHLVVDVVGYFRGPISPGAGLRIARDATVDTANTINGSSVNSVSAGVRGATVAGGGVPFGGDPNHAGDNPNVVTDDYGVIGGGFGNQAGNAAGPPTDAPFATVGGGRGNVASAIEATVAGGSSNDATGPQATVAGGVSNRAEAVGATVGGGLANYAQQPYATVGGGDSNTAAGDRSTIAGGTLNLTIGSATTVGGGNSNSATNARATVSGGQNNHASGASATIGGGMNHTVLGEWSTVGGGIGNQANASTVTIAGGSGNIAVSALATIGGGAGNGATGLYSTIVGGESNFTNGDHATIGGGQNNAAGQYAFAAGRRAKANSTGCFAWGDSNDADVTCSTANAFVTRATGGVAFWTNVGLTTGCSIAAGGGTWNCTSSRDEKRDFAPVDTALILDKVAALPISTWRYRSEASGASHIGPVSQDFHAAFGVGDSERTIGLIDANGVALAAIQGLNAKLEARLAARERDIEALREEIRALRREVARR